MIEKATRSAVLWVLSITLAALFSAFQIQSALHSGSLSVPVSYDDVGYFNDALARLEVLYLDGGKAFLKQFWTNPPHAPLQTLLALLGFGVFGPAPWAADAMNALPLAIVLRLFLEFACRSLPLPVAALAGTAFLGYPLLGLFVLEFRPDMMCALLTSIGALIVVADPRWREGRRVTLGTTVALFVGALLAKPTLAPVTVAVFGAAFFAAVTLHSNSRTEAKKIVRIAFVCGALGVLIVLPYYVAILPHLIDYISVNALGINAHLWRANLSWSNHALYYLTGAGGLIAIGRAWLVLGCTIMILTLPLAIRFHRTTLAIFLVALMAYAGVTVPAMKSPFLGVIVSAFLLCIIAILVVQILKRLPRQFLLVAALGLLTFSALTWRPVALILNTFGRPATGMQAEQYTRIYSQTADALASISDLGRRQLYFPVIAQYLNPDNIEFELRRRNFPVPTMPRVYHDGDISAHRDLISKSDLAVLFSNETTLPNPWPASTGVRNEIGSALAATNSFELFATVDGGPFGGQVLIFKRKGT
ncbi:hypothetical protein [Variovorax rhizosphaerae]|uniref:Glycosyltransferase RgtA/B/C/D-like domain-containing protein n=1 Tax=Variovorax rhizosphaerae TaxID=1836200 RepID=A0ABU8WJF0_9BURK